MAVDSFYANLGLKFKLCSLMATWVVMVCSVNYCLEIIVYALYRYTGEFGKVWD